MSPGKYPPASSAREKILRSPRTGYKAAATVFKLLRLEISREDRDCESVGIPFVNHRAIRIQGFPRNALLSTLSTFVLKGMKNRLLPKQPRYLIHRGSSLTLLEQFEIDLKNPRREVWQKPPSRQLPDPRAGFAGRGRRCALEEEARPQLLKEIISGGFSLWPSAIEIGRR